MCLEQKAKEFAANAHFGQTRKYTGALYIIHPEAVASIIREVKHTEEMLAAAWLHDVVEDCGVTLQEIQDNFGWNVSNLVDWVTNPKPVGLNRKVRKQLEAKKIRLAPAAAQTSRLADILDNIPTIVKYDPEFAKVYIPEKIELLQSLKEGDGKLWMEVCITLHAALLPQKE
jgi:(p)ppGpp synthase/HD superfamily hydrolase